MTLLQAIALGVLQGLTEFLPVSSSGHLALAEHFLAVESPGVTFEVLVHFGTALAVIVYFRRRICEILRAVVLWGARREHEAGDARLGLLLLVGTLPAAAVGLLFEKSVESAFDNPVLVSVCLLVTGRALGDEEGARAEQGDNGRRGCAADRPGSGGRRAARDLAVGRNDLDGAWAGACA